MEESVCLWLGEPLLLENRSHHCHMSISVFVCDQGSANTRVWSQPERMPSALCQLSNPFSNTLLAAAAKSLQLCPTLCDPMDCSPPDSSVHNFQARILEFLFPSPGIFPTQESNPHLLCHLHLQADCLLLSYPGSPPRKAAGSKHLPH